MNNKVSIKITNNRHSLRIIVRFNDKRFFIYPGLKDNHVNRLICMDIKRIILADIELNNFDYSFVSYKYKNKNVLDNKKYSFIELASQYLKIKTINNTDNTKKTNQIFINQFNTFVNNKLINNITVKDIKNYYYYLLDNNNKYSTIKIKLNLINNIFIWSIANYKLNSDINPVKLFIEQSINLKINNDNKIKNYKIFNDDEIESIYYWFIENKLVMLANYTYFKFQTGLRPGEINALTLDSFNNNNSIININKSWNGKNYRPTKTYKNRKFKLNHNLIKFITNHINVFCNDCSLIFYDEYNNINCNDYLYLWNKCLNDLNIIKTPPYNTRHTFISKKLLEGKNPVTIAKITGHKVETLFKVYARFFDDIPSI